MPKESLLPLKSAFTSSDFVRMVIGGISSDVRSDAFASGISTLLSSTVSGVAIRTTGTDESGSINSSDNVVATDGTLSLSMPNPNLVYDATNGKSNIITVAQKTAGTVTINQFNSDLFYNGDGSPSTSYELSGGAYVSFVTDGTDWIVVGA